MSGGGGDNNDGLWMLFFILAMICALLWAVWHFFTPQVLQGYLWLRQGEMTIASLWTDNNYNVEVITTRGTQNISFGEAKNIIKSVTPEQMLTDRFDHWQIINATSLAILKPLRFFFGGLFALMMYYALFFGPTSHHRKKFNLQTLIQKQAQTFPAIAPIINFNPLTDTPHRSPGSLVPAKLPLFAEALSPEEWAAFHKIPTPDGKVDKEFTEEALQIQLGERWQGTKKLPPYMQVILAACALKAARKRSEADSLLGELALCWTHKQGLKIESSVLSKARKILRNKNISASTLAVCNRHAFVTTALLGALDYARSEGGVLAPAQFLWLRGHDRNLWYPLNNLGRQAFHVEAMGAMSHYRAEKLVGRPIPKPMLKDAVDVLASYLEDNKRSMPIPQLDFSMIKNKKAPTKNKGIMKPVGT